MCLVSVYGKKKNGQDEVLLAKNVTKILIEGEKISFYDILGQSNTVKGFITEADMEENFVKLSYAD